MRLIDADELTEKAYIVFDTPIIDLSDIENAPTIDHIKHGKWNKKVEHHGGNSLDIWIECSVCEAKEDYYNGQYYMFCPYCGTKMDL